MIEYVTSLLYKAMDGAAARGKGGRGKACPVTPEDILFLVRKVGRCRGPFPGYVREGWPRARDGGAAWAGHAFPSGCQAWNTHVISSQP